MKNTMLFLLLIIGSYSYSQTTYSNDRAKFIKELQSSMAQYATDEQSQFVKKELSVMLLQTTEFPDRYFTNLVATCNTLISKRFSVVPDVYNYVFSIYSLVKNKQNESSYNAYQSAVDKLLESRNPKRFTDFADLSAGFFSEGRLAGKSNFEWFYKGGKYEFKYDEKAYIQLSDGNLICRAVDIGTTKKEAKYVDSMVVFKTTGTYDPALQKWEGNGGIVTWEKVGLPKNETYAEVGKFQLSMKNTNMNIDSVKLKTPYFNEVLLGSLSDRAFKINREEDRLFPQFISYKTDLKINNIKPNTNYEGAFSLKGAKFIGTGAKNIPAKIVILKNSKPYIISKANEIYITDKQIYSYTTSSKIIFNTGDSLIHPSNNFTYYYNDGIIEFSRPTTGLGQSPFIDYYHQLFYYVPKIILNEKDNKIYFTYEKGTSQEQRVARFESFNYYDGQLYDKLQGFSSVHPLVAISRYGYKYDKDEITEGECASALGGTIEQVRSLMLQLANYGFINYDTENKKVFITQKLNNFVKGKAGKKDFDNIIFTADFRPKELKGYTDEEIKNNPNLQQIKENYKTQNEARRILENFGHFDLSSMDMSLSGIDRITISDKQNVHIYPNQNTVTVKQNRDIEFSGWLNAGKAEINTVSANYNYALNKINLLKTNESVFRVQPRKAEDGTAGIAMSSTISGIVGDVVIDLPDNRSGNKEDATTSIYPILTIKNTTKIYYNSPDLYKGAYDSTRFYYTLQPFTVDSVDNFNDKSWRLKGELISAGIFPVIKEDLKVMPDYSFGFSTTSPKDGFEFYGVAKYDNKVMLSGNGLQGAGTINFVKSTSVSKGLLTFLPDSTIGVVSFMNEPVQTGIQFPKATCEEAFLTYIPRKKILKATTMPRSEFEFFDKEANLKGTAIVTPKGIEGNGLMSFKNATIVSKKFVYEYKDLYADTSSFALKNQNREEGEAPLVFETANVKSHVSFTDRKGVFNSNKGESRVDFPVNQYMCKMDLFTWFMDQDELAMEKKATKDMDITAGVDLLGPNFFSLHPKQDSLQFRAPKAKLDMKEKSIYCSEVEYIDVADARIYPDSMKVNIRRKAKLDQFNNATIVANYITKYHKFTKSKVDITARRAYNGSGEYPYYDRDSILTYITMNSIGLDSSYQTRATGKISGNQGFKLSPEFDYYGDIIVKASTPEILFNGATRINHNCVDFEKNWLAFSSSIDPKNVQIPVSSSMKNLDGQAISAGIVWRDSPVVDSIALYPTFLSKLVNENDPIVVTSSGLLTYDHESKEYRIATKDKLINRTEKGNFLSMNTETCSLFGEGVIDLGMNHGDVQISTAGMVDYNSKTGEAFFNLTAKFDIPLDKSVFKNIPDKINATDGLKSIDFATNTLKSAITTWSSQAEADKLEENFTIKGEVKKLPSCLESTITITGLKLSYYSKPRLNNFKGLITNTESAILVNVFDKPVMKYVPFKAFFQQKHSGAGGDWFALLMDIPGGKDYFFNYSMGRKDGVMDIMTGDSELATDISALKEDKRKKKNFIYQLGQGGLKTVFFNLFSE
ncbi:MAG: hypothetical protein M9916_02610 [Crocinitomicaceae bacterium]|nr:hypothetical protein [Crocinitomicaceae bacterium]